MMMVGADAGVLEMKTEGARRGPGKRTVVLRAQMTTRVDKQESHEAATLKHGVQDCTSFIVMGFSPC
eukprot:3888758-Rhodomonas_salina.1